MITQKLAINEVDPKDLIPKEETNDKPEFDNRDTVIPGGSDPDL